MTRSLRILQKEGLQGRYLQLKQGPIKNHEFFSAEDPAKPGCLEKQDAMEQTA